MTIEGFEHLGELRLMDLVAKTGKLSLKDAVRALVAARLVMEHFDIDIDKLVDEDYNVTVTRPSPENTAACELAYAELEAAVEASDDLFTVNALSAIQHFR